VSSTAFVRPEGREKYAPPIPVLSGNIIRSVPPQAIIIECDCGESIVKFVPGAGEVGSVIVPLTSAGTIIFPDCAGTNVTGAATFTTLRPVTEVPSIVLMTADFITPACESTTNSSPVRPVAAGNCGIVTFPIIVTS
jgi:hypothetical protein